ncbi:MAG: hypothetical protein QOJ64_2739 [Acidobacteriota bacterium]|nr:hypothetical protein [Acidobacteriota bacterium]
MTQAARVFKYFAVAGMVSAISILSACSSGDVANGNSSNASISNSTASANSNAAPAVASPSPTAQMESFTADSLIEALKKNRDEVDKRLTYQEISISGPVKVADTHNVEFTSKDGGKVNCSLASDVDKALVDKLYASSKGSSLPLATAVGTYNLSVPPASKPTWYIGLKQCRLEAGAK